MELFMTTTGIKVTGTPEELATYMAELSRAQSAQASQEIGKALMDFSSLWSSITVLRMISKAVYRPQREVIAMNDKAQHHFDAAQDFFWEAGRKFGEFLEALGAGLCETSSYLVESVGDLASFSVSCFELKNALDQAPSKLKHRALYCKRWRIQKKYLDRIQREYREKKEG